MISCLAELTGLHNVGFRSILASWWETVLKRQGNANPNAQMSTKESHVFAEPAWQTLPKSLLHMQNLRHPLSPRTDFLQLAR